MAYNIAMVNTFRQALADSENVEERDMFGSLGFMINGKLTACVRVSNVMYRVGPVGASKAVESGEAEPVIMNGRTMKAWILIDNGHIEKAKAFNKFLKAALDYNTSIC